MVKYYGRARQRIGSVNTNQIGLKMSGCPSKVGRQGYLSRYIGRRAQCNQKFCGPVFYHGALWSWNSGRCVAKAPRGQSFNSGVGHKSTPRFACGNTCETGLDALAAVKILQEYLQVKYNGQGSLILVGTRETLKTDKVLCNICGEIKHFDPTHPEYYTLPPIVRAAADFINNLGIIAPLKKGGPSVPHIAGYESYIGQGALLYNGFGFPLKFGPETSILVFGRNELSTCCKLPKKMKPFGYPLEYGTSGTKKSGIVGVTPGTRGYWRVGIEAGTFNGTMVIDPNWGISDLFKYALCCSHGEWDQKNNRYKTIQDTLIGDDDKQRFNKTHWKVRFAARWEGHGYNQLAADGVIEPPPGSFPQAGQNKISLGTSESSKAVYPLLNDDEFEIGTVMTVIGWGVINHPAFQAGTSPSGMPGTYNSIQLKFVPKN